MRKEAEVYSKKLSKRGVVSIFLCYLWRNYYLINCIAQCILFIFVGISQSYSSIYEGILRTIFLFVLLILCCSPTK